MRVIVIISYSLTGQNQNPVSSLSPGVFYTKIFSFIQFKSLGITKPSANRKGFVWFVFKVERKEVDSWGEIQIVQKRLQTEPCQVLATSFLIAAFRAGGSGSMRRLERWAAVREGWAQRETGESRAVRLNCNVITLVPKADSVLKLLL